MSKGSSGSDPESRTEGSLQFHLCQLVENGGFRTNFLKMNNAEDEAPIRPAASGSDIDLKPYSFGTFQKLEDGTGR
jgi:hypothetical protein